MPTRRQLESLMGGYDDFPSYAPPGRSRSLLDLTMEQGRIGAENAYQQGNIWSQALMSAGQQIAGGLQAHQEQKALKKRDAAWIDYIGRGEWANDPKKAYADSVRIWGPDEGPKQFQALVGVSQLGQPKRDPAADMKALGAVGGAMSKMSDQGRAALWPQAVALTRGAFPELQLPEQYDPKVWAEVEPLLGQLAGGGGEGFTLKPGEQRFGPDGKPLASVAPEPPRTPEPRVVGRSLVGPDGKVIYRDPEPRGEPKEPKLVPVKTVGPDGKAVTRYVTPKEGDEFPEPTGQGKPATGQQRRALSFFNRAKEADEVAAALEEGDKISPTALKYTPDFANVLLSDSNQSYKQAQRAFTEARLRKESGATIKDEEYENDSKTYFPQPGDSNATKKQKREMRRQVLAGIALESGDALREFYGDEAEGMIPSLRGTPASLPKVVTEADYAKIPSGAEYIDPYGKRKRKR